jgi:hypothetical protein
MMTVTYDDEGNQGWLRWIRGASGKRNSPDRACCLGSGVQKDRPQKAAIA